MANYIKKTPEEKEAEVKALTAQLEAGVKDIFTSGKFTEYLKTMSNFHSYSARNTLLIMMQHPTAQYVAGYEAWQKKFNRHVIKGQKGISILAPNRKKGKREVELPDGTKVEEEFYFTKGFNVVKVFADDQTDGQPLPSICTKLEGKAEDFERIKGSLEEASCFPVFYEDVPGDANGYFSPVDERIVVQTGMSEAQTIKTLVHELTHSILHCEGGDQEDADRETKEVQAESVAYVVCNYLGIDSSDYSFGYVAGWAEGKEAKLLHKNLDIIQKTASEIIEAVAA